MTLSEYIIAFRTQNNISQRKLAEICELSNGYISMLENGKNPKTDLPITPTIPQLMKLAKGMGTNIGHLFNIIDDLQIDLQNTESSLLLDSSGYMPETQNLLVFNMNNRKIHEHTIADNKTLNEINKLSKALMPYPPEQINALLQIVENGGNIPISADMPEDIKELLATAVSLSPESRQALIQVAKTMR